MEYKNKDCCYSTNEIICPYCHQAITPDEGFYYSEDYTKETCGDCGKEFTVEVYHQTSWTTFPIKE